MQGAVDQIRGPKTQNWASFSFDEPQQFSDESQETRLCVSVGMVGKPGATAGWSVAALRCRDLNDPFISAV